MKTVFEPLFSKELKTILEQNEKVIRQLKEKRIKTISEQIKTKNIISSSFSINSDFVVNAGDIVKRPLKSFPSGTSLDLYHYGIALGLDTLNKKYVLEISDGSDVSIKTLELFLKPYNSDTLTIERKPKNTSFTDIINRADTLVFERNSIERLNCEQFARYCVFNKAESKGLQNITKFSWLLLDCLISYTDLVVVHSKNTRQTKRFEDLNKKLKAVNRNIKKLK